jgi:hypothetical protein
LSARHVLARLVGLVALEPHPRRLQLHVEDREVMADGVVHVAREAGALLGDGELAHARGVPLQLGVCGPELPEQRPAPRLARRGARGHGADADDERGGGQPVGGVFHGGLDSLARVIEVIADRDGREEPRGVGDGPARAEQEDRVGDGERVQPHGEAEAGEVDDEGAGEQEEGRGERPRPVRGAPGEQQPGERERGVGGRDGERPEAGPGARHVADVRRDEVAPEDEAEEAVHVPLGGAMGKGPLPPETLPKRG